MRGRNIMGLLALATVAAASTAAAAQSNPATPVAPCSVQGYAATDTNAIKRQIRMLRRAGYRVDVTTAAGTKRVANGGPNSKPSLMTALVPVSGC